MKRKFLVLLVLIAFLFIPSRLIGQLLTDFYSYSFMIGQSGYTVSLNPDFKDNYLNVNEIKSFTSGGFTWTTGDPLPNPAPNGKYNNLRVTIMNRMFYGCNNITHLDLSEFDTSNVTDMNTMFYNCSKLTDLDLSGFDTSKVTDMRAMFYNCSKLTDLDLSGFNTSNVADMKTMFYQCSSLTNLDLYSFDFTNVSNDNLSGMFSYCGKATNNIPAKGLVINSEIALRLNTQSYTSIDPNRLVFISPITDFYNYTLSGDNTYSVSLTDDFKSGLNSGTFSGAQGGIWNAGEPLPNPAPYGMYNGVPVTDMSNMFHDCSTITSLDLSKFDTSNVNDMSNMFANCSNLTNINLSKFNTSNTKYMSNMFKGCSSLRSLEISNFNTSLVEKMDSMFYECSGFTILDLYYFNTTKVTNMSAMFASCSSLTSLDLSNFDISNVTEMTSIFSDCGKAIDEIPAKGLTISSTNITKFNNSSETGIDVTKLNFELVPNLEDFYNYALSTTKDSYKVSLTASFISGLNSGKFTAPNKFVWNAGNPLPNPARDGKYKGLPVTDMSTMFFNLYKLRSLNLSEFDTSNVTDMSRMFDACSALISINLSSFNTSKVKSMSNMFLACWALTSLDLSNFRTPNLTNMSWMFDSCRALTSLDLSNFSTVNVTNMGGLFKGCSGLKSLDISNFETSNTSYMANMFTSCSSLTSLDLSKFIAPKSSSTDEMFSNCYSLASLDISNFNTSNVTSMAKMFQNCYSLTSLDISNFDTSKVTTMSGMFQSCGKLGNLDLSNFKTSNVTNMSEMFYQCNALTNIELSNFDTSNVTNMNSMFQGCSLLTNLNLSQFDTSKVTQMNSMFYGNSSVESLDLSNFDIANVTDMKSMFSNCGKDMEGTPAKGWVMNSEIATKFNDPNITGINASKLVFNVVIDITDFYKYDLSETGDSYQVSLTDKFKSAIGSDSFIGANGHIWYNYDPLPNPAPNGVYNNIPVTSMSGMFDNCTDIINIDISRFDTSNVTDMSYMFSNCYLLESLDLSNFDTSNVTDMYSMFTNSYSLKSLNLSNFNTANTTNMSSIFNGCSGLTSLNIYNFDTSNVTGMSGMFQNCSSLTSLDLSNFDTSKVLYMGWMFSECSALNSLDLSNFTATNIIDISYMFNKCGKLELLNLSNFDISKVSKSNMSSMFFNCGTAKNGTPTKGIAINAETATIFNTPYYTNIYTGYLFFVDRMTDFYSYTLSSENTYSVSLTDTFKAALSSGIFNGANGCTWKAGEPLPNPAPNGMYNGFPVTNMSEMFKGCNSLSNLYLSIFDISNVTNMEHMFEDCGMMDGSGQASIGVTKDWETAHKLNYSGTSVSGSFIDKSKLRFGVADKYNDLDYILFQDEDESNKSATLVASSTDPYAGSVVIANNVMVGTDNYSVMAIAPMAFKDCSNLSGVEISENIAKVGDYSFVGSYPSLKINMHIDIPPAVTDLAFDDAHYASAILTVHSNAKADYAAHTVWNKFTNMPTGFENANKDKSEIKIARIPNGVIVSGIEAGETVKLYSGEGALIRSVKASDSLVTIDGIQSGMYIVTIGSKAVKVVI